ncbi:MAG TPA: hypothetical protein VJ692_15015 [Nitrospiraceae bacterium]|nr:hypothetical protein [Nitrospiraceae bacterium]
MTQRSLITGGLAGLATCLIAGLCAKAERQSAWSAVNATSHIVWGERAARRDTASWKYTGTGVALNEVALIFWALLFERSSSGEPAGGGWPLVRGAAVSTLAYVTDYYLIPPRFTPGFEKRLSNTSLAVIYGGIGISLPLCSRAAAGLAQLLNRKSTAISGRTE